MRMCLGHSLSLTPVRTADDFIVATCPRRRGACDSKVRQLHASVFVRQDIGTFDVAVDHTLIVQVHQTLQDLRDVHGNEWFGKLAEALAYVVQRAILAESRYTVSLTHTAFRCG